MQRIDLTKDQYLALRAAFQAANAEAYYGDYEGSSHVLGEMYLAEGDGAYWLGVSQTEQAPVSEDSWLDDEGVSPSLREHWDYLDWESRQAACVHTCTAPIASCEG